MGCPKNEVDSDLIASRLLRKGWIKVDDPMMAELMVVNTCSFIANAVEDAIELILELAELRNNSSRKLVVAGCLVARYGKSELAKLLPEVDMFLDFGDYVDLCGFLAGNSEPVVEKGVPEEYRDFCSTMEKGYAYIKVSEGCRRKCSFCTIPSIRGPLRSRPMKHIIEEGRRLVELGARELVLIAQDTTSYGLDIYHRPCLHLLLEKLSDMEGDYRIRVMYMHPDGLNDEILKSMANPRVCRYLDIPFQHANSRLLRTMGRKGSGGRFLGLLDGVREKLGDVTLRSSFIVGFPGEDREGFKDLVDFVAEARFDWLGLFGYSQEEGTPAYCLGEGVSQRTRKDRLEELRLLQEEIMRERAEGLIGKEYQLLIEGTSLEAPGFWEARSCREAPEVDGVVFLPGRQGLRPGVLSEAEIVASEGVDLIGRLKEWGETDKGLEGTGYNERSKRPYRTAHSIVAGYRTFTTGRGPL